MKRGIYFIANDRVMELSLAFLNSLRSHEPDIPLCLVPFNDEFQEIASLSDDYKFTVFKETDLLRRCDHISHQFHDGTYGHYRKFALWDGPFEEFLYIDIDTVVLSKVDFTFDLLARYDVSVSQSDGDIANVWKNSVYTSRKLSKRQIGFAANTGCICSRRGVLPLNTVEERLDEALALKSHMTTSTFEQPVLNYFLVSSGLRYTSFALLANLERLYPRIRTELWAGKRGVAFRGGRTVDPKEKLFLVHWAGEWQPRGASTVIPRPGLPYRDLWLHYRNLRTALTSAP